MLQPALRVEQLVSLLVAAVSSTSSSNPHELSDSVGTRNNELDAGLNIDETVLKLLTVFYGTPFSLFILDNDELEKNYKINLKSILNT